MQIEDKPNIICTMRYVLKPPQPHNPQSKGLWVVGVLVKYE